MSVQQVRTSTLRLDLAVNPVPQARPVVVFKAGRRGGGHAFTPDRTRRFYDDLRWAIKAAGIRRPMHGPLRLTLRLWRQCRGSARGDLSNMVKAIEDAGNGFLFDDDEQIIQLTATLEAWGPKITGRIIIELTQLASTEEPMHSP